MKKKRSNRVLTSYDVCIHCENRYWGCSNVMLCMLCKKPDGAHRIIGIANEEGWTGKPIPADCDKQLEHVLSNVKGPEHI